MNEIPATPRPRMALILAGGVVIAIVALILTALEPGSTEGWRASLQSRLAAGWQLLQNAPAPIYFGVTALALALPIPGSVLYITAGPIYGIELSLLWLLPTLALNAALVYLVSASFLRPWLEAIAKRRGFHIPQPKTKREAFYLLLLIRMTPGSPYFLQSWTLGMAGIPFWPFVIVSTGVQIFYAAGFIILGQSAFEGRLGVTLFAVVLIVVAGLVARWIHGRLRVSTPNSADRTEET